MTPATMTPMTMTMLRSTTYDQHNMKRWRKHRVSIFIGLFLLVTKISQSVFVVPEHINDIMSTQRMHLLSVCVCVLVK